MNQAGQLRIVREFAAPRPEVFSWWAAPEKLSQWSGCKEATTCRVEMDFRVGGSFTQRMQLQGLGEFVITGRYEEIVVPERIVYVADLSFATSRVAVEFTETVTGTRVTVSQEGLDHPVVFDNVSRGTADSFAKLETLLTPCKELA
ncbi:MAG TPA: SRPBCC domain-containing protein [Candidatus Limnocylindrales bacterium]|nr:SRPBCC domain-containing protein [Candidatus Limnocylindrales bacterium]